MTHDTSLTPNWHHSRIGSTRVAFAVYVFVILIGTTYPAHANLPNRSSNTTSRSSIALGIFQPPTYDYGNEIKAINALANKNHALTLVYTDWSQPFSTFAFLQDQINKQIPSADRPILMIAWGPTNGRKLLGCDTDYSGAVLLTKIISGSCDSYIRQYANAMKARSERFLLKFAHEMNGLQPWSPTNFNQSPQVYVDAWRHVKNIFAQVNTPNVEWVWGPIYKSNPDTPANQPENYYPGNQYVDWVAVSGFNYYDTWTPKRPWTTFKEIFGGILFRFGCMYPKPQLVHEFAGVEDTSGNYSKSQWIISAYTEMQDFPLLHGIIWYNDTDFNYPQIDYRITTSTNAANQVVGLPIDSKSWTEAYKTAIAPSVFSSKLISLANATSSIATSERCSKQFLPLINN